MLLPVSLVGSYPQPEWLIDRAKLAAHGVPRVRAPQLWRIAEPYLDEAQRDATLGAIRSQEEAGLDIITDGEIRRESAFGKMQAMVEGARSFLDRLVSVPDTIGLAPQIKCPVLGIRGDKEDRDRYPAEEFQAAVAGPCEVRIVENCDHFYRGRESHVAGIVAQWLASTFRLPR